MHNDFKLVKCLIKQFSNLNALYFFSIFLLLIGISTSIHAEESNAVPSSFSADISKPVENIDSNCNTNHSPDIKACTKSNMQWQAYNQPIRHCIPGDVIIPAQNNKVLSYILGTSADANVTISILGWQNNRCQLDFKVGSLIKSCKLTHRFLSELMGNLLNPDIFDTNGKLAQNLTSACQ